jgi:hypothetical protein
MKSYRSSNNRYLFGEQINITLSSGAAYIGTIFDEAQEKK